jgi:ABC-2 type transport system permease protein
MSVSTDERTPARPAMLRLVRSELLKISTTNVWWIFLIGVFLATGAAFAVWAIVGHLQIAEAETAAGREFIPTPGMPEGLIEVERQQFELAQDLSRTLNNVAAEIYTSGQFFGLLFALLLGALLITNEYHHQTATATFLTTPQRSWVILAKLKTAMLGAGLFWLFALVISLGAGAAFFAIKGYAPRLDQWPVWQGILLNGLAYGLWGMIGVGLGVLIRSQIAAVLTGAIAYVVGGLVFRNIVLTLAFLLDWEWLLDASLIWPGIASQVMISPEQIWPGSPPWWVGALVLLGYAVVVGAIGTMITRRRDIA